MVFLFNDVVFDLGDMRARLASGACPVSEETLKRMPTAQLLGLVKEAMFRAPDYHRASPEKAQALAVMVHMKTGANAILCVRGPETADPAGMLLRLGDVSLTVAGDLLRRQREGELTPRTIDAAVWAA